MDVNINNYEELAMDYLEGNLEANTQEAMEAFLIDHPEIKNELTDLCEMVVVPEAIPYPNKSLLKKERKGVIIPGSWFRMGAAAACGGLLSFFAYNFFFPTANDIPVQADVEKSTPIIKTDIEESNELVAELPTESVTTDKTPAIVKSTDKKVTKVKKAVPDKTIPRSSTASVINSTPQPKPVEQIVSPKVVMPAIPAPVYETSEELYAEVKPSTDKRSVNINQFDLNQMLGVTSDSSPNTTTSLKDQNTLNQDDGFEVESFSTDKSNETITLENNGSLNTLDNNGDVSNSLLPKSFGLKITKTKINKPSKKKKGNQH